ncbi:MAG: PspC domain-containing protein [Desulfitobacteriaceae bacterium]
MTERLYRSGREKMIGGVCGGLAEYFHVDVTLVRLIALVAMFAGGIGFLAYFVGLIIIPINPEHKDSGLTNISPKETIEEVFTNVFQHNACSDEHRKRAKLGGIILIVLGCLFFLDRWFPVFSMSKMWPLILIIIGLAILWRGERK